MQAHNILRNNRNLFEEKKSDNDALLATVNETVFEALNDESVFIEEIMGQETWMFSDGSYITRLDDEYWPGDDVDEFKATEDMMND